MPGASVSRDERSLLKNNSRNATFMSPCIGKHDSPRNSSFEQLATDFTDLHGISQPGSVGRLGVWPLWGHKIKIRDNPCNPWLIP